ncbi:MAG: type II toxin-antitoxin system VapC family toxin, partial [Chitinophagaceae bacterium]|nr:type II toxin-antitoxin system VapC family toxin [Chitinophagaceae bacterium]
VFEKLSTLSIGEVGISSITLAELEFGVYKSSNPQKNSEALDQFITPLEIVDFTFEAAVMYGKIRAGLERKGTPIGSMDYLIGSHALALDLILVTNNEVEFRRIDGLKFENWVKQL